MADEIPKQDLLAKLLKMTTSDNDGEALSAIRKANTLLRTAGWDWDKLLAGKIKIAADPFANLATPYNPVEHNAPAAPPRPPRSVHTPPPPPHRQPPPQRPAPPRQPAPPPPPPPQAKPSFEPFSEQTTNGQVNQYPGNCYCCGYSVSAKTGKLFNPAVFNHAAPSKKFPICTSCDTNKYTFIDKRPAPQPKTPFTGTPHVNDL